MACYRLRVDYLRWRLSLLSLSLYAIFYATASNLSSFPFLSLLPHQSLKPQEIIYLEFLDEFEANLPLPLLKKTGDDRQLFSEPTAQVAMLYPPTALQEPTAPPQQDIALPGQPNLAVRVMTLERLVADLQERLTQLET